MKDYTVQGIAFVKDVPSPSPSASPSASPSPSPSASPIPGGNVTVEVDKTDVKVGDIVTATISVKDIADLGGFQVNLKFDPLVFQALNSSTNEALKSTTKIPGGTVITNDDEFSVVEVASHDLANGTINFGRSYLLLDEYRESGNAETTGVLGVIKFKALKATSETKLELVNAVTMPQGIEGTILIDWNSVQIKDYTTVQAPAIKVSDETPSTGKYGDVNGDGNITSTDYAYVQRYILGMIGKDGYKIPNGYELSDVDGTKFKNPEKEEYVTSTDLAYIKRVILGMIEDKDFPVYQYVSYNN
jgi:hypothetical protein